MPNAAGKFKGTGWTRSSAAAWDRIFGPPKGAFGLPRPDVPDLMAALEASLSAVPREPSREVEWLADRTAAVADGWAREDYDQQRSAFKASD